MLRKAEDLTPEAIKALNVLFTPIEGVIEPGQHLAIVAMDAGTMITVCRACYLARYGEFERLVGCADNERDLLLALVPHIREYLEENESWAVFIHDTMAEIINQIQHRAGRCPRHTTVDGAS